LSARTSVSENPARFSPTRFKPQGVTLK